MRESRIKTVRCFQNEMGTGGGGMLLWTYEKVRSRSPELAEKGCTSGLIRVVWEHLVIYSIKVCRRVSMLHTRQ